MNKGVIYILFNPSFEYYGQHVYKLGRTKDPKSRKNGYRTPFIDESNYLYISKEFRDSSKAEQILFYLLRQKRCKQNREFFDCPLEKCINVINNLESCTDDEINQLYSFTDREILPFHIETILCTETLKKDNNNSNLYQLLQVENTETSDNKTSDNTQLSSLMNSCNINHPTFKNPSDIDQFLDQFRFKPKVPDVYIKHGYIDPNSLTQFIYKKRDKCISK